MTKKGRDLAQVFAVSLSRKSGAVSRELLPIRLGIGQKPEIKLRMKSSQLRRYQTDLGIQSIKVRSRKIDLNELMKFLSQEYADRDRLVIWAALIRGRSREKWMPEWAANTKDDFDTLERTRRRLETLKNNGGTSSEIRFFDHLRVVCEAALSFQISGIKTDAYAVICDEIKHFHQGFDVRV